MTAYYNEIDPFAAAWLRELIRAGEIAPGDVDERSIEDVTPSDLLGYTQCHFFAGIGVWSRALRSAGWSDDRQVWTGSCPCQPFSAAGKGKGLADERHLWPAFFHLIEVCGPELVFGEQVAGKDGLGWLDLVSTDLETVGYACGAVPAPAAGFGAPHIRERLYWVADASSVGRLGRRAGEAGHEPGAVQRLDGLRDARRLADADNARLEGRGQPGRERADERSAGRDSVASGVDDPDGSRYIGPVSQSEGAARDKARMRLPDPGCSLGGMANTDSRECGGVADQPRPECDRADPGWQEGLCEPQPCGDVGGPRATNGFWRDVDWLYGRDGQFRPVEPGTFPLADGVPSRVVRLRAYGNAIVPQVAATFIEASESS